MTRPPLSYRAASLGLALPFAVYTALRALRDGGWRYARERLGLVPARDDRPVWIHCASVGEVIAALPLVAELETRGIGPLLLTANTPTGRRIAASRASAAVACAQAPLDRPAPVRRFLERTGPRAAVILETELWPWLFAGAAQRAIPVAIVNGRLSRRTREAPHWLRRAAAFCLARVAVVLARSSDDAAAFCALGAPAERVHAIGNLKLAAPAAPPAAAERLGRPYVLAASTHDDEETQLAAAWCAAPREALLAIAPRHPERGEAIAAALRDRGLAVARRSQGDPAAPDTDVYLADTLGELPALIAGAEIVIMGGSLIAHGGQNLLEPARAARPIVTGPHMDNFREETAALARAGGLRQGADAAAVVTAVAELLADPAARGAMGAHAAGLLASAGDMAARYREALVETLGAALDGAVAAEPAGVVRPGRSARHADIERSSDY